jgi:hypothetical protein
MPCLIPKKHRGHYTSFDGGDVPFYVGRTLGHGNGIGCIIYSTRDILPHDITTVFCLFRLGIGVGQVGCFACKILVPSNHFTPASGSDDSAISISTENSSLLILSPVRVAV